MPPKRVFELDVLRGIAILLVMGVHVPAYPIWSTFGVFGVDLFFVLSGFLISNLLFSEYIRTGDIGFRRFFIRRAMKLYPSFYLLLLATAVYCFLRNVPFSARDLFGEATLTQNYIGSKWGHTWSLAVEEHFYVLLPLAMAYLLRRGRGLADPFRAIPGLFAVVGAGCLIARLAAAWWHPEFSHRIHYEPSHSRFDSLFFGVLISYLHNFRPEVIRRAMTPPWRFPVSLAGIAGLAPALVLPASDPVVHTIGFTLLYFSFGTTILLVLYPERPRKPVAPGLAMRAAARMGVYSYTLYLWHVPMAQLFGFLSARFGVNQYVMHAIYFAASIAAGVLAAKLVEIPILNLRERLTPAAIARTPLAAEEPAARRGAEDTGFGHGIGPLPGGRGPETVA